MVLSELPRSTLNCSDQQSHHSGIALPGHWPALPAEERPAAAKPKLPADEHEVTDDDLEHAVRLVTASAAAAAKAHQSAQQHARPQAQQSTASHDSPPPAPAQASSSRPDYRLSLFHSSPRPLAASQAQSQSQEQSSASRSLPHAPPPHPHPLASHPHRVQSATPRNPVPETKTYPPSLAPQGQTKSWRAQPPICSLPLPTTPALDGKRPGSPQADAGRGKRRNHSRRRAKDGDPTPWQCTECGRKYSRAEYLRRHQRTHEQVRPWSCVCGKTFGRSDVFTRHRRQCRSVRAAALEAALARPAPGLLAQLNGAAPSPPPTVTPQSTGVPTPQTGSPAPTGSFGTASSMGQVDLSPVPAAPSCFSSFDPGRDGVPANDQGIASPSPSLSATARSHSQSLTLPSVEDHNFSAKCEARRTASATPAPPDTEASTATADDTRGLACLSHSPAPTLACEESAMASTSGEVEEQDKMRFEQLSASNFTADFEGTMAEEHDVLESLRRLLEGHGSGAEGEERGITSSHSPDASAEEDLDVSIFPAQAAGESNTEAQLPDPAHLPSSLVESDPAGTVREVDDLSNLPLVFEFPGASTVSPEAPAPSTDSPAAAEPDASCPPTSEPTPQSQSRARSSANAFSAWHRQARPFTPHSVLRGMAASSPGLHLRLPLPSDEQESSSGTGHCSTPDPALLDSVLVLEDQPEPSLPPDERHEVQTC